MPSITFSTAGPISWRCPPNVTSVQVECIGGGSPGSIPAITGPGVIIAAGIIARTAGPAGGGGAEYSAEPVISTIPGTVYTGVVAAGGAPGAAGGGTTTFNNGQVTAHGAIGRSGGTGSSNTVHHNGGTGGAGGSAGTGGGGGGSGAPAAAGNNGAAGGSNGGAGGIAQAGGSAGGHGGAAGKSGSNGGKPGGGGGAAGFISGKTKITSGTTSAGGAGGSGMIRITWTAAASVYPAPAVPFFPAGFAPAQADLDSWLHDPFAFFESRAVARVRQAAAAQSLPAAGTTEVLGFDTVDEDPLGGWLSSEFAWMPPPGFTGWYEVTVTLFTAAVPALAVIRAGLTAPFSPGQVASGYPGAGSTGGVTGVFWVFMIGGQDTVQATGTLLNSTTAVNTSITAGQQSSMEITWIAT